MADAGNNESLLHPERMNSESFRRRDSSAQAHHILLHALNQVGMDQRNITDGVH